MKLSERTILVSYLIVIAVVTSIYYGPFLHNFFTYDDFGLLELATRGPKSMLLGYNYTLRFVNNAVWIPLHALFDFNPLGYNLFSASLWFLNGVLLYRFLRRLLEDPWLAAATGVVFSTAAVGCDAVFWRAASGTLINVAFYLLTLDAYTRFRRTGDIRQWRLSVGLFVLAMFSKEEAASLPLVVVLLEWLYFNRKSDIRGVVRRILVYCAIIGSSVLLNYVIIYQVLQVNSELVRIARFRPLHSLLSGWTVFFLAPDGRLAVDDPRIYITAVLVPLSFFIVKDRRLLILGLGWIFLSFLPQSLSGVTQFEPVNLFSSLSRQLYLPSIGAAIAVSALFAGVRDRFSPRTAGVSAGLFLLLFIPYNYTQVAARGEQWRDVGEPMNQFLTAVKRVAPQFPPNTYISMQRRPTGRAYVQQGLRAFYHNMSIFWVVDPATFQPKAGDTAILITPTFGPDGEVALTLSPLE